MSDDGLSHWQPITQGRRFFAALPGLLPAAVFSALVELEWLLPALVGEARIAAWPFALAFGNAWLLGATARAQGLTGQGGFSYGWQRVGDLLTCAAIYWLLTVAYLFLVAGVLRVLFDRPLHGIEADPQMDQAFFWALPALVYVLLRVTSSCLGPLLDDRHGAWPRMPACLWHGWRLTRGWQAHARAVLPMALGLSAVVALQLLREKIAAPQGWEWLAQWLWHGLAWPAFGWLCWSAAMRWLLRTPAEAWAAARGKRHRRRATTHQRWHPLRRQKRRAILAAARAGTFPCRKRKRSFYYSPDWSATDTYLSAAVNGDVEKLRAMIAAGTEVDTCDKEGVTAMLRAAQAGKPKAVRFLLEAGADVTARNASGRSLVHHCAAFPANLSLLDSPLQRGLDVDDQHDGGDTPLMAALLAGHLDGARALLERGADPTRRDRHGNTCVIKMIDGIYAFRQGADHRDALALLEQLLRCGVDPAAVGQYGNTAMSLLASRKGLRDVVAVLRRHGIASDRRGADGLTPLQQAWSGDHKELLSDLLAQRVAIDFHSAVALGRDVEVEALLAENPAYLDQELPALRSAPLAIAISRGNADMVRRLLRHGADIHGRDPVAGALANAIFPIPMCCAC